MSEENVEERHKADELERIANSMLAYCQVLRGERIDFTGLGEWRIICNNLERTMKVKITPVVEAAQ